jgi:hypothetical protein
MIQFIGCALFLSSNKGMVFSGALALVMAIFQFEYLGFDSDLLEYFSRKMIFFIPMHLREFLFWWPLFLLRTYLGTYVSYILIYTLLNSIIFRLCHIYEFRFRDSVIFLVPFAVFGYSNTIRQYFATIIMLIIMKYSNKYLPFISGLFHNSLFLINLMTIRSRISLLIFLFLILFIEPAELGSANLGGYKFDVLYLFVALFLSLFISLEKFGLILISYLVLSKYLSFDMIERVLSNLIFVMLVVMPKKYAVIRRGVSVCFFSFGLFLESYVRFL